MPAKAIIISIGDEILYGQTLDTNAHWISNELDTLGVQVFKRFTIGDIKEEILKTLKEAEAEADIILITGGLGPTSDDLTKPCLVEYFKTHLVRDEDMLENIRTLFSARGREMTTLNEEQADMPASSKPIKNVIGTAPGMWFERNGKVMVSMPGVPYEMRRMMTDTVLPKLKELFIDVGVYHRIIRTIGIPESKLAEMIKDWEKSLPSEVKLAYLPTMGTVKLRLTSKGKDEDHLQKLMQSEIDKVLPVINKYVYGFDNEEIEQAIGRILTAENKKLAIAESCTGGFLAHKITSVPGSSGWFQGGMVPYSNQIKNEVLQVSNETLKEHGAVSEPVVLALAENVRKNFSADIGISISGIAGPSGGTKDKPVGMVWIGYSDEYKTVAKKFQFTKDRMLNIQYTSIAALNMIRINLNNN